MSGKLIEMSEKMEEVVEILNRRREDVAMDDDGADNDSDDTMHKLRQCNPTILHSYGRGRVINNYIYIRYNYDRNDMNIMDWRSF